MSVKSDLRASSRVYRAAQTRGDARAAKQLLACPEVAAAKTVSGYWGIDEEPAPQSIFPELRVRGVRLLLPIVNPDWSLDWGDWEDDESLIERRRLWEPRKSLGSEAIAQAEVIIAPGLRVDRRGVRLGQGAGCFDRALAIASPSAWVVALLHEGEISDDEIPEEIHDRRVNAVATPSGIIRFDSRRP